MRTPVKILTPTERKALRARPGECAAPRHVDVVDARANMRTVHLQAKGRVHQEVRRWLSTIVVKRRWGPGEVVSACVANPGIHGVGRLPTGDIRVCVYYRIFLIEAFPRHRSTASSHWWRIES